MSYLSIEEVKRKMERYCAYQERSHYQVERKLREMGMISDAVDHIVLHLLQENFLNEERFARAYVRGKFYQKQWGKLKIRQGLKQHYINDKLIDKALEEIDLSDYQDTLKRLIAKKNETLKAKNQYEKKQKLIKYLNQKGYKYDEFSEFLA